MTNPLLGGETGVGLAVHHGIKAPEYQGSIVATEFQVIISIVMISIVECRDDSPPGRGNRGGFSCAPWYQGARIPGHQLSLLKFQVIISIVMICIVE